jgi:hypothetical protein
MNDIDPTDSEAKRELRNWKPRQRQTPILDIRNSSSFHYERSRQEQSREEYSREERENFSSVIPVTPAKSLPFIYNSPTKIKEAGIHTSPTKIPESPIQQKVHSNITPTRKSVSPKLFNNSPIWRPSSAVDPVVRDSPRMQKSPTTIQQDFASLDSSSDKTLTPQDFEEPEEAESDKFEKVFKQLNRGIADLRQSLTRHPTKYLSDSRLYDSQKYSSDQSLSTSR